MTAHSGFVLGATESVAWRTEASLKGQGHVSRLHQREVGFNGTLCGIYPPADAVVGGYGISDLRRCQACVRVKQQRQERLA